MKKAKAQQVTLDLYHCDIDQLKNISFLKQLITDAMQSGKMPSIFDHVHNENEVDFSIVAVSTGGHLTLHSFPENGFVALDIFSCDPIVNPEAIGISIKVALNPDSSKMTYLQRGTSATDMKPRRKNQTKPLRQVKNVGEKALKLLTGNKNSQNGYMD